MEYLTRSKAAFRLSVDTFFRHVDEGLHQAFLWTFTLRECVSVREAFRAWNKLAKSLWKYGLHPQTGEQTIFGLRVAEFHPGGHGVHFHVLLNRRIPIHAVRRRAEQFGFFWIDVRRAYDNGGRMAGYLGKYLSKQDRAECMKGRRLWQAFGKWGQTRCKDVLVESEFVAAYHHRRKALLAEARIAEMEERQYRMEHALETMWHAKEHCFLVLTGKREPLMPHLWYSPPDEEPVRKGFEDWESDWYDVETGAKALLVAGVGE